MARNSFDIEKFVQSMTPNLTKRFGTSSSTTRANKLKAGVAQGAANRKRATAKKMGAEGPKRSVAKKTSKAAKITRRPMESGNQTTIRTPKTGTRTSYMGTIKTQKGRTTTTKYPSGTKEVSTKVPKRAGKTVTKTTKAPSKMRYGNR